MARYWRITSIDTPGGGDLCMSELRLHDVDGVIPPGYLTCSHVPVHGSLATLEDDSTSADVRFPGAAISSSGFRFIWDFGADCDVIAVSVGAGTDAREYIAGALLERSSDGLVWESYWRIGKMAWPGPHQPGAVYVRSLGQAALLCQFNGSDGVVPGIDYTSTPRTWTVVGSAAIRTAQSRFGGASLRLDGLSGYLYMPNQPAMRLRGDFTLAAWVWIDPTSAANFNMLMSQRQSDARGWGLYIGQSGHVLLQGGLGSPGYLFTDAGLIQVGRWHHVAICKSGGLTRILVDGVERASATESECYWSDEKDAPFCVGFQRMGSSYPFKGYVDDLVVSEADDLPLPAIGPPTPGLAFEPSILRSSRAALRIAAAAPLSVSEMLNARSQLARDTEFGGTGTIYGTTKVKGAPNLATKARVVLLHQRSKLLVRETWSDPVTGAFVFIGIDTGQQFLALAEDAEGHFRPVAANRLTPEVA